MTPMMRRNAAWLPSVFNDFFDTDFMPRANATAPAINVKESDKGYTVELAAPGMTKDDFNVHINDEGNLIIKMEQKNEKKEEDKSVRYLRREFSYTKYEQTLILPDDVKKDTISAKVENGVLTVELPKVVEEKVKVSRQIEIG
ncbi:Hsp20/alpha crystallin family protein [Prevotella sp. E9-3]|uniref:Hsp20/alpha crystallin family protein n=1 Tax=Prevotella sp. E9-3 TaxID=2913621 RepID=UPI001EDBCC65|nr:Hsp20/alpha crystallin family protein [Prevotella sp. E9-3]UKK47629.1 Hsp20/alpha crystallin family protein [Prevotella sp. E9-3]